MRYAVLAAVLLVPSTARAQEDAEARKLFEAMEQKLTRARAFKVDFTASVAAAFGGDTSFTMDLKGTFVVAAGNKFRLQAAGKEGRRAAKAVMVSDGTTLTVRNDNGTATRSVPEKLSEMLGMWATRVVVSGGWSEVNASTGTIALTLKPSGFKSAGKDRVGDREANVVEYALPDLPSKYPVTCKLWLDAQTNLPLQRTLAMGGSDGLRVIETYTRWEIDPELTEGTFILPE
jgi:outer membrane lipoprotein-sorting protein